MLTVWPTEDETLCHKKELKFGYMNSATIKKIKLVWM